MKQTLEATRRLVLSGEESNRALVDLDSLDLPWVNEDNGGKKQLTFNLCQSDGNKFLLGSALSKKLMKVAADAAQTHSEVANRVNEALIKAVSTLMSNPNIVGGNIEKMNKTLVNTSLIIYKIKVATPEGMLRVFFTMIPPSVDSITSKSRNLRLYPRFVKLAVCRKQDEEAVYKEIGSGKRSGKSMAGLT